jgi:hypothetical protein
MCTTLAENPEKQGLFRKRFAKVNKGLVESGAKSVERLLASCFPRPQKLLHEKANDCRHA